MSNLAKKEAFVPRKNLQRTLRLRDSIGAFHHYVLFGWVVYSIASVSLAGSDFSNFLLAGIVTVLVGCAIAATFLTDKFVTKRHELFRADVFPDRLEISVKKRTEIPYQDIKEVKLFYIPYFYGHFTIVTDKKNYRIGASLERSEYILESIHSYDAKLISLEDLENYRRTSIVVDHTWGHYNDSFKDKKALIGKFLLNPLVAALPVFVVNGFKHQVFTFMQLGLMTVAMSLLTLLVSPVAWWVTSMVLVAKTRSSLIQDPNKPLRDIKGEQERDRTSQLGQILLLGGMSLAWCLYIYLN